MVTRDREGAAPYAAALAPLGLDAIAMPVTRTAPPADPGALSRAIERGGHAAIVCASARAAAALIEARGGATLPEVWAVGPATGRVLEAAGLRTVVPGGVRDGASLARALLAARELAGRRVLVPRAEEGREEAIALLRDAGAEIEDVVAYRTVPAAADDPAIAEGLSVLAAGRAALCVVLAPSQVAALGALVGPAAWAALPFAAIGETTAAALRAAGATVVAVAETPTPAGIASAAASVYPRRP